ncbi:MAG: SdrD B-like domain-containing protein [Bacillota bacterium]
MKALWTLFVLVFFGIACGPVCLAYAEQVEPGVSITIPSLSPVSPGDVVGVVFLLANRFGAARKYRLELEQEKGWPVLGWEMEITVPAGTEKAVLITLVIPDYASPAEAEKITLKLSAQERGVSYSAAVSIPVAEKTDFIIQAPERIQARPESRCSFNVQIKNTGNMQETFLISVGHTLWQAKAVPSEITLAGGEVGQVTVELAVPSTALAEDAAYVEVAVKASRTQKSAARKVFLSYEGSGAQFEYEEPRHFLNGQLGLDYTGQTGEDASTCLKASFRLNGLLGDGVSLDVFGQLNTDWVKSTGYFIYSTPGARFSFGRFVKNWSGLTMPYRPSTSVDFVWKREEKTYGLMLGEPGEGGNPSWFAFSVYDEESRFHYRYFDNTYSMSNGGLSRNRTFEIWRNTRFGFWSFDNMCAFGINSDSRFNYGLGFQLKNVYDRGLFRTDFQFNNLLNRASRFIRFDVGGRHSFGADYLFSYEYSSRREWYPDLGPEAALFDYGFLLKTVLWRGLQIYWQQKTADIEMSSDLKSEEQKWGARYEKSLWGNNLTMGFVRSASPTDISKNGDIWSAAVYRMFAGGKFGWEHLWQEDGAIWNQANVIRLRRIGSGNWIFDGMWEAAIRDGDAENSFNLTLSYNGYPSTDWSISYSSNVGDARVGVYKATFTKSFPVYFRIPTGFLTGACFHDANGNGVRDPGEQALEGILVSINGYKCRSGENGIYRFAAMAPGMYYLEARDAYNGLYQLEDGVWRVKVNKNEVAVLDLPFIRTTNLTGTVYIDLNKNGKRDEGEKGVAGVTIQLFTGEGVLFGEAVSLSDGGYDFFGIYPGIYYLKILSRTTPNLLSPFQEQYELSINQEGVMAMDLPCLERNRPVDMEDGQEKQPWIEVAVDEVARPGGRISIKVTSPSLQIAGAKLIMPDDTEVAMRQKNGVWRGEVKIPPEQKEGLFKMTLRVNAADGRVYNVSVTVIVTCG